LKAAGIADAVDIFLELVARMSQMIVRAEFDSRILGDALTTSPPVFEKKDEGKLRFLCEALGRLWLRWRYVLKAKFCFPQCMVP
jgi:hypothetical protein